MISMWHKVAGLIALALIILFRLNVLIQFLNKGNTGAAFVEAVVIMLLILVAIVGLRLPTTRRNSTNSVHIGHSVAKGQLSATPGTNTTDLQARKAKARRMSLAIGLMIVMLVPFAIVGGVLL